jgi:hypothetical protein
MHRDPLDAGPAVPEPITAVEPAPVAPGSASAVPPPPISPELVTTAPPGPAGTEQSEESGQGGGAKVKVAAVVAGAAALANKVRKEAPKKVREVREKRVADRCVIVTEAGGCPVAIGPYRNEQAARQDLAQVAGAPQVVELKSRAAYFAAPDGGPTTTLP